MHYVNANIQPLLLMIESLRRKSSRGGILTKSRKVKQRRCYSEKKGASESASYYILTVSVCERFGDTMVNELSNTWNVLHSCD